jgi:NADH dehydrogenase/NADH:ubiquinone oxidoreductase subunit G
MADLINIKINQKDYQLPADMNLVDAAQSVGIHIPNLCYLKGMKGIGACRLCMVEINGKMATACTTKIKGGMDVVTDNEKILELRKFVIDLILSMHPLDCMTCTKAGICQLQQYAYDFGIKESSFTRKQFHFHQHAENPFLKIVPDYCILCGRCVRVCKEQGTNVLDFKGRGIDTRIGTAQDKRLADANCTFCGSCLDVCPVNAILEADRWRKGREWHYQKVQTVCLLCGSTCQIKASNYEGDVVKINADADPGAAERYICARGRYGFDCRKTDRRATVPVKRVNGGYQETTWDDALALVAEKMKSPDAGIITTARMTTNEDALAMVDLVEKAGINHLDSTVSLYADADSLLGPKVDLNEADLIVLVRLEPSQWERNLPGLDATIRKMVQRKTKLVVISDHDSKHAEIASVTIQDNEANALKSLAKAIIDKGLTAPAGLDVAGAAVNETIEQAAKFYLEAKNPVIITTPSLYEAARNIAMMKGAALSVPIEANSKGVMLMGLTGKGKSYHDMVQGGVKTLYIIGEAPFDKRPPVDFLIVQNSHMTDLAAEADIVLPSATYLEKDGSIVDYMGRLRQLKKVVEPVEKGKAHVNIVIELAKKMGVDVSMPSESEIRKRAEATVAPTVKPFAKKEGFEVDPTVMVDKSDISVIKFSRACP